LITISHLVTKERITMKHLRRPVVTAALGSLLILFVLSGCRSPQQRAITVAGSRSVLPVVQEIANAYVSEHPGATIDVQGIGTSAGLEAVRNGTADIGMASRNLKDSEKADLLPTLIALDAVAVVVHPGNTTGSLTIDQVRGIFSGAIRNWSEVGGADRPIVIIDKEAGSGTKAVFEELLMKDEAIGTSAIIIDGTPAARQAVASDPAAIGYISLAAVTPEVKAIALDGVMPSKENVQTGKYPLSQPFVIATKKSPSQLSRQFIEYVLGQKGQGIAAQAGLITVK
jgi:phosphate transport system substrate-binding protein